MPATISEIGRRGRRAWRGDLRITIAPSAVEMSRGVPAARSISRARALGITTATLPPTCLTVTVIGTPVILYYIDKALGNHLRSLRVFFLDDTCRPCLF